MSFTSSSLPTNPAPAWHKMPNRSHNFSRMEFPIWKKPAQISFPFAVIFVFHVEVNLISVQLFRLINSMPLLNCYYTFSSCCCLLLFSSTFQACQALDFFSWELSIFDLRLSFFSTLFPLRVEKFSLFHMWIRTQLVTMDYMVGIEKKKLRTVAVVLEVQCTANAFDLVRTKIRSFDEFWPSFESRPHMWAWHIV